MTAPLAATVLAGALRCSGGNGVLRDVGNNVLAASAGYTLAALAAPALPEGVRVAVLWAGLVTLIAVRGRTGTKRPAADGDGESG